MSGSNSEDRFARRAVERPGLILCLAALAVLAQAGGQGPRRAELGNELRADEPRAIDVRRTADQVRYGLIGSPAGSPAPTLFVFAHSIETMKTAPVYTEVSAILAKKGWLSVIVEPPCHGEDERPDEPKQLEGWRHRLDRDGDFLPPFIARARAVLDTLIEEKLVDPERVAACGTSRGGFLAYHFAAAEPRVKAAAGISPVTRLRALREFATTEPADRADRLDAANLAPRLAGRAIWLSIGNHDARVDTDAAIAFTRAVVQASKPPEASNPVIPVDLLVGPSPGHAMIQQAHQRLAEWLESRIPARPAEK